MADLCSTDDVKLQASIPDTDDDLWIAGAIASVSAIMETATRRWLAPRGALTRYFDGALSIDSRTFPVRDGLESLIYLGVAYADQPDDGTGTYSAVTLSTVHLRGRLGHDWPATRLELGQTANLALPTCGHNVVKVTASWGPTAVAPRINELATIAVVRAFRARSDGSGSPDIAIVGPEGGMRILRRIAPDEMDELLRGWAPDTRPRFASVAFS